MIHGMWRGHPMYYDTQDWRFVDDNSLVALGESRPCGCCGEYTTPAGHDPCIANLPSVMNACCGHGCIEDAYVQFVDGRRLRGPAAVEFQTKQRVVG